MERAFNRLQQAFTTAPVMVHFDPDKLIRLETDSSGFTIAGILSQPVDPNCRKAPEEAPTPVKKVAREWHPVALWSRTMTPAERNYTVGDQEMLASVMLCRHWRHYLEGSWHPVVVLTDDHNLQQFMTTKPITPRQAGWWETLSSYLLDIQYRTGKINSADAPSPRPDYRVPSKMPQQGMAHAAPRLQPHALTSNQLRGKRSAHGVVLAMLADVDRCRDHALRQAFATAAAEEQSYDNLPPDTLQELVKRSLEEDPVAKEARQALELPRSPPKKSYDQSTKKLINYRNTLEDVDGLLYRKKRLYVPPLGGARTEILPRNHDDPKAGHFAAKRTLDLVARKYYWPGMEKDVKQYADTCAICAKSKSRTHKLYSKPQSLPIPTKPSTDILLDFITGLPRSSRTAETRGKNVILVIIDRFTKMVRYLAVTNKITAPKLAELLVWKLALKGAEIPSSIVSDRGPMLTSKFWSAFCYYLRIRRRMSSAYHPQTDGKTER